MPRQDYGKPSFPQGVELSDRKPNVLGAAAALANEIPRVINGYEPGASSYRIVGAVEVGGFSRLHTAGNRPYPHCPR
jgi:hypothetical protein